MMQLKIVNLSEDIASVSKALAHFPFAGLGHLPEWGEIIKNAYGMDSTFLAATNGSTIMGLLPLVFIKSRLFGNALVSMPYLNDGGILAMDRAAEILLWSKAKSLMEESHMSYVELRHARNLELSVSPRLDKVGMILDLRGGKNDVWDKKFHSNVRNKIRKSKKMGVEINEGAEWLDAFYIMHIMNMRELGSPPHSLRFFKEIIKTLGDRFRIYVATLEDTVIGGKAVCYFRDTVFFLWVSSPRKYHKFAAISLMDWRAIEDAIERGMKYCDFGRSTMESSHFQFKKKWGSEIKQLYWHVYPEGKTNDVENKFNSKKYKLLTNLWRKLPISIVRLVGPRLRRGLSQ